MSWGLIVTLVAVTYLIRVSGFTLLVNRDVPTVVMKSLAYVPAALLAALVAVQTLTLDGAYVFDARIGGVLATGVAVALRVPFAAVFVVGVGTTALLRFFF